MKLKEQIKLKEMSPIDLFFTENIDEDRNQNIILIRRSIREKVIQ